MNTAEDHLRVRRSGAVMIVELNRPEKRNALTRAMSDALVEAALEAERDPQVRVGVLASAAPGMFCAGADLQEVSGDVLADGRRGASQSFVTLQRRKPWIAAISGPVLGGGLELALACEMIVAAQGTTLSLPEALRGLIAGGGGLIRLPRLVPRAVAMEMLLTGARITSERALELGILNRLAAEDELRSSALDLAQGVCAASPAAIAETLAFLRDARSLDEAGQWTLNGQALQRIFASEDCREGMQAFRERRAPVWPGLGAPVAST